MEYERLAGVRDSVDDSFFSVTLGFLTISFLTVIIFSDNVVDFVLQWRGRRDETGVDLFAKDAGGRW